MTIYYIINKRKGASEFEKKKKQTYTNVGVFFYLKLNLESSEL